MLLSGQSNEVTSRSPTAHLSATPWVATFSLSPDDFSACLVPLDLHHHHLPPGLLSSLLGLLPPPLQAGLLYNPHLQSRVFPSQIRAPRQALHFLTTSPTHFVSHIYSLLLSPRPPRQTVILVLTVSLAPGLMPSTFQLFSESPHSQGSGLEGPQTYKVCTKSFCLWELCPGDLPFPLGIVSHRVDPHIGPLPLNSSCCLVGLGLWTPKTTVPPTVGVSSFAHLTLWPPCSQSLPQP